MRPLWRRGRPVTIQSLQRDRERVAETYIVLLRKVKNLFIMFDRVGIQSCLELAWKLYNDRG